MPLSCRYLPRSLRRQFTLAVGALALLILAGGLTAFYALRTSATTIRLLAEDRLAHMQDSQDMVQRTLLIERESFQLARAESLTDFQANYADIVDQMERFDDLVARLAAVGDDAALLELHQASQLFRNTANIVGQLRERDRQTSASQTERQATTTEFDDELRRQASALVASAQALNNQYARAYREAITELAASSGAKERWVEILLAGSLLLA